MARENGPRKSVSKFLGLKTTNLRLENETLERRKN